MPSKEGGPRSLEEMGIDPKKVEKIKVVKKDQVPVKKLDIKLEDFQEVPPEVEGTEKQSDMDWAEDFRAKVKLKANEKLTVEQKAREDFKKLFGEKE